MKISFDNPIIHEDMDIVFNAIEPESFRDTSILITGASGMIASYMVAFFMYLNTKGYGINLYLAVRNQKKANSLFGSSEFIHYIHYDASEPFAFDGPKIDFIIHAASLASPQYYGSNPVETMLPNILGLHELARFATKCKPSNFLFFSTGSVYGDVTTNADSITEDLIGTLDYLSPGNEYGESKRCGESLGLAYCREYGIKFTIARISHSYGPTMDYENDSRVFSEFVKNAINHQDIVMKSEGLQMRPFCYMTDLLIQLLSILKDGKSGEAYNVGNPYSFVTISELADIVSSLVSPPLSVKKVQRVQNGYRPSPVIISVPLNIKKVEQLCQKPTVSISEGFARTIAAIQYDINNGNNNK